MRENRLLSVPIFIGMQLKEACAEFLRGYFAIHERRTKTRIAYSADLEQFHVFIGKDLDLLSLSSADIEQWAAHLRQDQYSPASIRRKIATLRVFCSYWVRKGILEESPFWRVKLNFGRIEQLPRTLTRREIRALLAQAWRNYSVVEAAQNRNGSNQTRSMQASFRRYRALRNLALIDLLFATGMRVGEVSSLDISDFLVEDLAFRIQGKGGRDRLAFVVDKETIHIQREHLKARIQIKTEGMSLFLNSSKGRLSTQGIANVIAQLRRQAKIERHITPHMLRHTVATLLLSNGADIRVVQEFLGHTSIATTQRYTHITKDHLVRALRKFHPSLRLRTEF